jgi:APA family basic amino acid/polyamine antiporter
MAEYRPKHRGLERVLGTGALFSTAYGNVGSSIYYALGLVAIYAAGMTPVVFVIAGPDLRRHGRHLRRGHHDVPRGGRLVQLRRRAFNEFWSFFAAWGQMLTYIITISISAVLRAALPRRVLEQARGVAGRHHRRHRRGRPAGTLNIVGVKESAGVNIGFAVADFMTQVILVIVGNVLVFDPDLLVRQVDFGTGADVGDFLIAIPVAIGAYTGHRGRSRTWPEEARDLRQDDPARESGSSSAPWP